MNNDMAKKYAEKLDRVTKTINLEQPDRVPFMGIIIGSWAAGYAGYTMKDIFFDYTKYDLAVNQVLQNFDFDCVRIAGGARPGPVFQALGESAKGFTTPGSQSPDDSILQYVDVSYMEAEEYPELIKDPFAFIFEKILPRKYPALRGNAPQQAIALAKSGMLYTKFGSAMRGFTQGWLNNYGNLSLTRGSARAPFDMLADFLRGFKDIMYDLRRYPEEVCSACEALLPLAIKGAKHSFGGPPQKFPFIYMTLHLATYLGPRSFEKFYWPTFKALIQALTDEGYGFLLFFQGNWNAYLDYLTDLPGDKGQILALFETVDMKRAKQVLGKKMCLAGNFSTELLLFGSSNEIEAHAKSLIDDAAPGGGYILTTDKSWLSVQDVKPEKVQILMDAVRRYGVY
ncbi:uroporphyrinogen decarboxylase family protein [Candidatus Formimonas warabiya]|nr:uroporphyrinogen decarboxylase family protein [Candidatus Formimonas warabiya]